MMRLFDLFTLLPHHQVPPEDKPLFRFEARRLDRWQTPAALHAWTQRRLLWWAGGAVLLWLLVSLLMARFDAVAVYDVVTVLVGFAFVTSLLEKFLFDFVAINAGLDMVNGDKRDGRWELIAVTDVDMQRLIRAKHAVAQLRAWRGMIAVIGLRLAVLLVMILLITVTPVLFPAGEFFGMDYFTVNSLDDVVAASFLLGAALLMASVYLLEPLWRSRALTAASLDISSRTRDFLGGLPLGLFAFIGTWWTQALAPLVTMVMIALFGSLLEQLLEALSVGVVISAMFLVFLIAAFFVSFTRLSYTTMINQRLWNTYRRLTPEDHILARIGEMDLVSGKKNGRNTSHLARPPAHPTGD